MSRLRSARLRYARGCWHPCEETPLVCTKLSTPSHVRKLQRDPRRQKCAERHRMPTAGQLLQIRF